MFYKYNIVILFQDLVFEALFLYKKFDKYKNIQSTYKVHLKYIQRKYTVHTQYIHSKYKVNTKYMENLLHWNILLSERFLDLFYFKISWYNWSHKINWFIILISKIYIHIWKIFFNNRCSLLNCNFKFIKWPNSVSFANEYIISKGLPL